ncbi:MAG: hypothetical protein ABIZ49_04985 [Opitutaceae bacterium]
MPRLAYRKARQHTLLWVAICFTGLAVEVGFVMWLSTTNRWSIMPWGWLLVLAVLPFVAAVGFGVFVMARLKRQRLGQLVAPCWELGFALNPNLTVEQKTALFVPLAPLVSQLDLRFGAERVVWIAPSSQQGNAELLFEHEYVTGSGKFTQVFTHTVVAWPVSHASIQGTHLATALPFAVAYDRVLRRRAWAKVACDVPALDELAKRWRVYGSPEAATRFLTPAARTELARAPVGERWYVGNGWLCCLYASNLDAQNLPAFVKHARHVLLSSIA